MFIWIQLMILIQTITNGINTVNNTKNVINSSNEVNAGSAIKK